MFLNDRPPYALHPDPLGRAHTHPDDPNELPETAEFGPPAEPIQVEVVGGRPSSWSSIAPALFFAIRDQLLQEWATQLDVPLSRLPITAGEATRVLNQYAESVRERTGSLPRDFIDVQNDPEVWTRLARRGNNSDLLPSFFQVETPQGFVIFENRPEAGPLPVPLSPQEASTESLRRIPEKSGGDPLDEKRFRAGQIPSFDPTPVDPRAFRVVTADSLASILNLRPQERTGGGGGGRGTLKFDRAQLAERFRNNWRLMMREDPANLNGLVSEFEGAANSTWKAGGAQTNADIWLNNRMMQESKWNLLYGRKDPAQSPIDYLQGFLSAEQFGLDPRIANREVIRGLSTGAAPASFAESVAFSRDVQALGQGSFSRRFANLINQMGVLQSA